MNYPLKVSKVNWQLLEPQNAGYSEDYIAGHYDLYLTSEYQPDNNGNIRIYYWNVMRETAIQPARSMVAPTQSREDTLFPLSAMTSWTR